MRFLTQKKDEGFSDTNVWIVSKVTLITIPSLTAHPLVPLLSPIFYVTSWNNEEEIDTLPWRVEPCFLSTRMCAFHELSVTLYLLLKIKRHSHIIMHFSFVKYHQVSKCKALQLSWDEGIESSPAGEGLGCTLGWEMDPEPRTHTHSPESQPCPGLPAEKCQHVKGGDPDPLLWYCDTPPGWLHPVLGSSAEQSAAGVGSVWGHEHGQWLEQLFVKAERAGCLQPAEEKALGRLLQPSNTSRGLLRKTERKGQSRF